MVRMMSSTVSSLSFEVSDCFELLIYCSHRFSLLSESRIGADYTEDADYSLAHPKFGFKKQTNYPSSVSRPHALAWGCPHRKKTLFFLNLLIS